MEYALENWSDMFDFQMVDLAVKDITISPCKGCVSTSDGMHCHWKCSCYGKGMEVPDLMYEKGVYDLLETCDAFLVVTPVHWYSVTTEVKAMFDRLVCANLTLTQEQAKEIFGPKGMKDAEVTGSAELSGKFKHLLKNHLEGKVAAFYVHGNAGADDYTVDKPDTGDEIWPVKNAVMPLVYQCRYSKIDAPDELIEAFDINAGQPYYEANLIMEFESEFFQRMDALLERLSSYLGVKVF